MGHGWRDLGDSWFQAMRQGDLETAWRVSDAVLESRVGKPCWHLPRHEQWLWDGRPLEGRRVLVRCYHGLGDTIQFARYLPLLAEVASSVSVWVQPQLIPLLQGMPVELLPLHEGEPGVSRDADVEIMELPHVFRSTLVTLPPAPYLRVQPSGPQGGVGLVWEAGRWDSSRSVSPDLLAGWAGLPVEWCLLQRGAPTRPSFGEDASTPDVLELARRMRSLDLVLTIDSMPAHLAGALGVPVWVLLKADPDWRWPEEGEGSPWYRSMRLYRQEHPGDWTPVLERVGEDLRALTRSAARRPPAAARLPLPAPRRQPGLRRAGSPRSGSAR